MASFTTSVVNNMTGRPGGGAPTPVVTAYSDAMSMDNTRRSPTDAGYVKTSARFTKVPRRYHIQYRAITTHDKNLIYNFEKDTVKGGAEAFDFDLPTSGGTVSVRFLGPVQYTPWNNTNYNYWNVEFDVETVGGV